MMTIDIADKLRMAHSEIATLKWRDLSSAEKAPWLRQAELVEKWIMDATEAAELGDEDWYYD